MQESLIFKSFLNSLKSNEKRYVCKMERCNIQNGTTFFVYESLIVSIVQNVAFVKCVERWTLFKIEFMLVHSIVRNVTWMYLVLQYFGHFWLKHEIYEMLAAIVRSQHFCFRFFIFRFSNRQTNEQEIAMRKWEQRLGGYVQRNDVFGWQIPMERNNNII